MAPKKLCDKAAKPQGKLAASQKKRDALCDKCQAGEPQSKRPCHAVSVQERGKENQAVEAVEVSGQKAPAENSLVVRGSGRGLKAIQNAKDQSITREAADGSRTVSRSSVREQKLFKAKSNEHVETKIMAESKKKTTRKDGTVVITETKNSRKVSYF
eukprot:TRINITY_DN44019_c0_g1_i1.p1 TRINITY_DN44019_c0_g1~~TRINITY_DN44019_c0_g1_i1.p1  ORF type:complete len:171 (-),score=36.88 TRINITY_DN44019_c0_g1_i1:104-574(-)